MHSVHRSTSGLVLGNKECLSKLGGLYSVSKLLVLNNISLLLVSLSSCTEVSFVVVTTAQ